MALGKGLSALIPDNQDGSSQGQGQAAQTLPVAKIQDNRFQPRQNYAEDKLAELVDSIKEKGVLQPIVVRPVGDQFEVIVGQRRLKAVRTLGLKDIPAVVKEASDKEVLVLAIVENVQREDLNVIEKAESYNRLVEEFGFTQEEVAKSVGKNRVTISNLLRLLRLPKEIKVGLFKGEISEGHARAILSVSEEAAQAILFFEIVQKGLSVREAEDRSKTVGEKRRAKKTKASLKDPETLKLEEDLRNILGTKVTIENTRKNKGTLVIEYYSLDDLDRILEVIRR